MDNDLIPRRLAYEENGQTRELRQDELPGRRQSIIVLGEAGMGKSEFARWLGRQGGHARCTARQLLNRHNPREQSPLAAMEWGYFGGIDARTILYRIPPLTGALTGTDS